MPHPSPQTTPYPRTRADLFFAPRRDATAELIVYDAAGHRAYLLNAAATIILSAYLIARLVVASCALNAILAGRSRPGDRLTLTG